MTYAIEDPARPPPWLSATGSCLALLRFSVLFSLRRPACCIIMFHSFPMVPTFSGFVLLFYDMHESLSFGRWHI